MTTKKVFAIYALTAVVISLPFTIIHLTANPDDAVITPFQHLTAAFANGFGPWGVVLVHLAAFPNTGLRSFRWTWAARLMLVGGLLLVLPMRVRHRTVQFLLIAIWGLFSVVWFGVGLIQIADGLL
ncbi:MAG TPA: hypothetical protein PK360_11260 [bacterium]|nr:hypothetical protein [bacterium]